MQFLGRIDHQVKVRGHRIELGEIERNLLACEAVTDAVVVVRNAGQSAELAAYIVAEPQWTAR